MLSLQVAILAAVAVVLAAQGQEPPRPLAPRTRTIRDVFREFVRRNMGSSPNSAGLLKRLAYDKKDSKRFIPGAFDTSYDSFGGGSQDFGSQGFNDQSYDSNNDDDDYYYDDEYYDDEYDDRR